MQQDQIISNAVIGQSSSVVRVVRASTVLVTAAGTAVVVLPTAGLADVETYGVLDRMTINTRSLTVRMDTEIGSMVVILPAATSLARLHQADIVLLRLVPPSLLTGEAASLDVGVA